MFRNLLGMSWVRYLESYRVQRAISLLGSSQHSVSDVAVATGFERLGSFDNVFHTLVGLSPRQYLKRNTESAKTADHKPPAGTDK